MRCGYKRQSAISNLENRVGGTGGNHIQKIAEALKVSVDWLLCGPDTDNVPFLPGLYDTAGLAQQHEHSVGPLHVAEPVALWPHVESQIDPWIREAIAILKTLQPHEKRGALANLRTFVYNLGPVQTPHATTSEELQ